MEESLKSGDHLTSPAAFVEGGVQEACDDACSICLEEFGESDPSSVTGCKHEFHLQCILEWCQRSSQCPMCWQPISLKDPSSQELLDAIEQEKTFRINAPRSTTIFHHPTLGDFELQHLPASATDAELEERIIQHLAAAAAMGRARRVARREGQRSRSAAQGRPHYLVFSTHPNASPVAPVSSSSQRVEGEPAAGVTLVEPTSQTTVGEDSSPLISPPSSYVRTDLVSASASGTSVLAASQHGTSSSNQSPTRPSPNSQDRAGPSDFQAFSESLKSRFSAMSIRYKDSIAKSTRGWKDRLFSRNTNMTDLSPQVRIEVDSGIATVPHVIEHLETRDDSETNTTTLVDSSAPDPSNQMISETGSNNALNEGNARASCVTGSGSD